MKNETIELSGIITDMRRLKRSLNGNPRFEFVICGKIICTKPDCTLGYSVQNFNNDTPCKITAKIWRNVLTLTNIDKV